MRNRGDGQQPDEAAQRVEEKDSRPHCAVSDMTLDKMILQEARNGTS